MPAILDRVKSFFGRPGAIEAIQAGDRTTAMAIAAQSDPNEHGAFVDSLIGIERERHEHREKAKQLPGARARLAELTAQLETAWTKEQERQQAYRLAVAPLVAEQTTLEASISRLSYSRRWLLEHIPADVQAKLDALNARRAELKPTIALHTEAEQNNRRTAERSRQRVERLRKNSAKLTEHTKGDIAQEETIIRNATAAADHHAELLAEAQAEVAELTREFDDTLARIAKGE